MSTPSQSRAQIPLRVSSIGLVAALATPLVLADVRNMATGSTHETIQGAVDVANDGDTLIVGGGSYDGFVIDGKGLTMRALPGAQPEILGQVRIEGLSATSAIQLDGLKVRGRLFGDGGGFWPYVHETALVINQSDGAVRLFRCELLGGSGVDHTDTSPPPAHYDKYYFPAGGHGLEVTSSIDLALLDCTLIGGQGSGDEGNWDMTSGHGGYGMWSVDSAVAVYDSHFAGGRGGLGGVEGENGGDGCLIDGLGMFASGSEFHGGDGGDVDPTFPVRSGNGGNGLSVELGSNVRLLDNEYSAGDGGCCSANGGLPGVPKYWAGGQLPDLPGEHRSLTGVHSLVGDGEFFQLHAEGEPGDRFFLAIAPRPAFQFVVDPAGVKLVHFPSHFDWNKSVLIGPSGSADWILPAWELPMNGLRNRTAQAYVRSASGDVSIGGAVLLTTIDDESGPDCNGNGRRDMFDLILGQETDCNGDLRPDTCAIQNDCNANGVDDILDIECLGVADSNGDGIPDSCDGFATIYVDVNAPAGGSGTASSPFNALAPAVSAVADGGSIEVAGGIYTGAQNRELDFGSKSVQIYSTSGSAGCVIDLQQSGLAFRSQSGAAQIRITGFTIENGVSSLWDPGAVYFPYLVEGRVEDCVFRNCEGGNSGGAIESGSDLELIGCEFDGNHSGNGGGAVRAYGRMSATRTRFTGNEGGSGGAIYLSAYDGVSYLGHCTFRNNSAEFSGGAVNQNNGEVVIDNSLFVDNEAGTAGGALFVGGGFTYNVSLLVSSSTLVGNQALGLSAGHGGGACMLSQENAVEFRNSIIWGNTAAIGPNLRLQGDSNNPIATMVLESCDLEGGEAAVVVANGSLTTNALLNADPLFVDAPGSDYQLAAGSPCADAGSNPWLGTDRLDVDLDFNRVEQVPLDLLGNPRRLDDPNAPDAGVGSAPITDMGAFER